MRPRAVAAGAILALWVGGLATLARRQFAGGEAARLARAALFVSPDFLPVPAFILARKR